MPIESTVLVKYGLRATVLAILTICVTLAIGLAVSEQVDAAFIPSDQQHLLNDFGAAYGDTDSTPQLSAEPAKGLGCFIPGARGLCIRTAGRRARDAEWELVTTKAVRLPYRRLWLDVPKWCLALVMSLMMLMATPSAWAKATNADPHAEFDDQSTGEAEQDLPAEIVEEPATHCHCEKGRRRCSEPSSNGKRNGYPRRPYWGSPNIVVTDPAEYPRPECLENNDPNSFWYSLRPNIFNVPVEAEWDFYNIINTDRPDFTDAVYSVGKGVTYLENGYTFHKTNTFDEHISTRQVPESLLRHGLTDEFELRLKWPGYLMTTVRDPHTGAQLNTFGSEDIDAAFKYEIWQQQGWLPMTTVVAGMTLPTGTPGTSANFVQPHFNIVSGWGLRRWLYLKWQTGCDYLHASNTQIVTPLAGSSTPTFVAVNAAQNSWHESISLLTQWTKRVGAFHEWFMISGTGGGDRSAQHFLDMGLYLYATPNIQFDVRVGRRISNRVDDFFTGAGVSGRW